MLDRPLDNAIADHKTYGNVEAQHRLFAGLRRDDPVHWTEPDGYRPFWTITKYADIVEIERQADRFINQPRTKLLSIDFETKVKEAMSGKPMLVRTLPQMDNPDHSKYQKLTHAWFQPRHIRTLSARMEALAKESVDRLCAIGGECDFYNEIAIYYPLRVVMTILGLPPEDEARLLKITQAYFGGGDPEMQKGNDLIDATMAYVDYFKDVVKQRRQDPKDDVATVIATSEIDGKPIGDFEAYSYYIALASAGHDTTSATIAGGLLALIENPDALARLQGNPDMLPDAAEEMVRWVSPVKHFFRTAVADYDIRGKTIKAGRQHFHQLPLGQPRRGSLRSSVRIHPRPFAQPASRLWLRNSCVHRQASGQGRNRGVLPRTAEADRADRTGRQSGLDGNLVPRRGEAAAGAVSRTIGSQYTA